MSSYSHFISKNVAPALSRCIGIFSKGKKVGHIPLGSLEPPNIRKRLYSFGVVSDPHIGEDGRLAKFEQAMDYFGRNADIAFICICGDIVNNAVDNPTDEHLWRDGYKTAIDTYANKKPVHAITGNHEMYTFCCEMSKKYVSPNVYYTVTHGDDVFIMLGCHSYWSTGGPRQIYTEEMLAEINEIFEQNKEKRCFVMQHIYPIEDNSEVHSPYVSLSTYRKCKNMTVFHGHAHGKFSNQITDGESANYSDLGFHSVHVSSLGDNGEGYIVDVYEDGIHLQGFNFETREYVPVASYWLATP